MAIVSALYCEGSCCVSAGVTDQTSTTASIAQKRLTITGLKAEDKVYDGTTTARLSTGSVVFEGMVVGDDVQLSATGNFDSRHVGQDKLVLLSSALGGVDVGNYSATLPAELTASITPAPLKIKAPTVRKTYDGTKLANGVATVVGTLAGEQAGDALISTSLSFVDKNAGSGKTVTVKDALLKDGTGADVTGNYSIEYVNNVDSLINKANASISAPATSVIYNGQTQYQGGAVLSGFVVGDDVRASGLASGRNVGTYRSSLSASGADVSNYNIAFNNEALSIGKKAANLSVMNQTVVYNGTTQTLNGTESAGFIAGDDLKFGGLPSGRQVGAYTAALTVSGADAGNYDVTAGNGTLTITPKQAQLIAKAQTRVYNGKTQIQDAADMQGFVAGDDVSVTGWAQGLHAGVYGSHLTVGGADAGNYNIRIEQADLMIQKAPLSFVGTSVADKLADGTTTAQVTPGRIQGLVGDETLNITTVSGAFDSPVPGMNKSVRVVYGLANGQNGGVVSNYDWSPVTAQANIMVAQGLNVFENAIATPPVTYSRLYFQGFGGLGGVGATINPTGYNIMVKNSQACTPQKLEKCVCERPAGSALEVCFPTERNVQALK